MLDTILLGLGIIGGITGCILVSLKHPVYANFTWIISNPLMAIHNYRVHEYYQMGLWMFYVCIAAFGILYDRRKQ